MTGRTLQVHIGADLNEVGDRFIDAWHRAERGELTEANAEYHVTFEDFATFMSALTPRRLELLRHVHRNPSLSAQALARALGREQAQVFADVQALVAAGLLDEDTDGLRTDYDTVHVDTKIAL